MKNLYTHVLVASALCLSANLSAQAALIDRGDGFIYDDVLDITWAENANIAATWNGSPANPDGTMTWDDAVAWADTYVQVHSDYGLFEDWRLPSTLQPDPSCSEQTSSGFSHGYNCTGSEMGHLFNVYGISASSPGPFYNLESGIYWSGTTHTGSDLFAWVNSSDTGGQGLARKHYENFAMAVRDGDIAASVVPVPAAAWLFGSALLGLGWLRRKKA